MLVLCESMDLPDGWRSYDSVAEQYEHAAVPFFGELARDLVDRVAPPPTGIVIDLGTGPGVVARATRTVLRPPGVVVGIDPSLAMLRQARAHDVIVAAGASPGLPLRTGFADTIIANLVLSHLARLRLAMDDIVRVLRPSGRLGASAWAEPSEHPDDQGIEACWVVAGVLAEFRLAVDTPEPAVPREEWLRDRDRLRETFAAAGLEHVEIDEREYPRTSTGGDFFAGAEWPGGARYLRTLTDADTWDRVRATAVASLEDHFPNGVHRIARVRFVTGTKPG